PAWIGKRTAEDGGEAPHIHARRHPPVQLGWDSVLWSTRTIDLSSLLGGKPKDLVGWQGVTDNAACLMEAVFPRGHFKPEDALHRRAHPDSPYQPLSVRVSHGRGQMEPSELSNHPQNVVISDEMLAHESFGRLVGFTNCLISHCSQSGTRRFNGPSLAASSQPVPSISARAATRPHLTSGISRGAGSTILIPSAIIRHSNIPVQPHEKCFSFTQYSAGGLFRWIRNGFKTDEAFDRTASQAEKEARAAEAEMCWEEGVNMFSIIDDLGEAKSGPASFLSYDHEQSASSSAEPRAKLKSRTPAARRHHTLKKYAESRPKKFYFIVFSGKNSAIYSLESAAVKTLPGIGKYEVLRCNTISQAVLEWERLCTAYHGGSCNLEKHIHLDDAAGLIALQAHRVEDSDGEDDTDNRIIDIVTSDDPLQIASLHALLRGPWMLRLQGTLAWVTGSASRKFKCEVNSTKVEGGIAKVEGSTMNVQADKLKARPIKVEGGMVKAEGASSAVQHLGTTKIPHDDEPCPTAGTASTISAAVQPLGALKIPHAQITPTASAPMVGSVSRVMEEIDSSSGSEMEGQTAMTRMRRNEEVKVVSSLHELEEVLEVGAEFYKKGKGKNIPNWYCVCAALMVTLAPEGADNAANNSETPASRSPSRRLFGDQDMSAAGHAATTSAPASDPPGATPHRGTSPENVPPDPLNSPENPLLDPVTSRTTTDSSGPHPTTSVYSGIHPFTFR
ncbi:hypothetical protein K438DRAFT_1788540, partial [Mycena galopus ATCC 62051]